MGGMDDLSQEDREMIVAITRMGLRAAVLLQGVMLKKVDREGLAWGLDGQLGASELMNRYFHRLIDHPEFVDLLNLLHLVSSLEGQWEFQVDEYGIDSLKEDLQEINFSLRQVGEKFDLNELRRTD
jgi:hypothetical protein